MGRRARFLLLSLGILFVILFLVAEITLRIAGIRPGKYQTINIEVHPQGHFFVRDSLLGFNTFPGIFTITLPGDYSFTVTHDSMNARITSIAPRADSLPEIWLLGCSYTHGWSLNDSSTFAWKLQQMMPEISIRNFGKSGFSNLQSLLQLQRLLASTNKDPMAVILIYAGFHEVRNTATRSWRNTLATYNQLGPLDYPVAYLDDQEHLQWQYLPLEPSPRPLASISAIAELIRRKKDQQEDGRVYNTLVTKKIIEEFRNTCVSRGIEFNMAGIMGDDRTIEMLNYANMLGVEVEDISVDLSIPGNTNEPYDPHPSEKANEAYSTHLYSAIQSWYRANINIRK